MALSSAFILLGVAADPTAPVQNPETPAWLPLAPDGSQPIAYADAKNGNYWLNGALAARDDVLTEDLAWGPFDPAVDVVPGFGLQAISDSTAAPAILGVADAIATGITVVVTATMGVEDTGQSIGISVFDEPAFANELDTYLYSPPGTANDSYGDGGSQIYTAVSVVGANGWAVNLSPTRMAFSLNTSTVEGINFAEVQPRTTLIIDPSNPSVSPNMWTETIAVYALQDEADLPTMSAV